ncbi:LacI family DNA-binding transcriptional regulator [Granulicella sp. 5B5]|nr:LacI family DNA-binding transcriptional regulator [Granulicella sp. 5B5]
MLAEYLDLSAATVSFVLNDAPNRSIPETTRQRVREAAKRFGYQPSHIARSLQGRRSLTMGILLPELSDGYHSQVLSGAADILMKDGYFFLTAHHRHKADLVSEYPGLLVSRGVEGILFIDTHFEKAPPCSAVSIAAHTVVPGVANVALDHERAAELALGHLYQLGHRKIAFMRGQLFSSDARSRWRSTLRVARSLGLQVSPELTMHLDRHSHSPELGYSSVQQLLMRRRDFTAVLCFNDVAAIGVIRALHDAGLRVPIDVSVVGFDDIMSAEFYTPRLTTIRQPLQEMGMVAASLLLKKLSGGRVPELSKIEPELIVRESSARVRSSRK